jgi:hypothetical protein
VIGFYITTEEGGKMSDTKLDIPAISDVRIGELLDKFKPVIRFEGPLYYVEFTNPRNVTLTTSAILGKYAAGLRELHRSAAVFPSNRLGTFKPGLIEALAQIRFPAAYWHMVAAFEVADPMREEKRREEIRREAIEKGFFATEIVYYAKIR